MYLLVSGFVFTSKPHHAAVSTKLRRAGLDISTRAPLPSCRRRHRTTAGAQRDGGYGRFSDTDDEPSFRPPPPVAGAGAGSSGREWQEIGNADVLVPKDVEYPLGVVHFVGGQGVGVFPRNAYGALLEGLVDAGRCRVIMFVCLLFGTSVCISIMRDRRGGLLVAHAGTVSGWVVVTNRARPLEQP